MHTQPVPDSFYYFVFFAAFLALATERAWHIALLCVFDRSRGPFKQVGNRFFFTVISLLPSVVVILTLLMQYGVHRTQLGLTYLYHSDQLLGITAWVLVIIHLITIPVMVVFAIWIYMEPAVSKRR